MRKAVLSLAMISALAVGKAATASPIDASVFGGYTTLAMGDFNTALNGIHHGGSGESDFGGGYYVGLDASYQLSPMFSVGPRLEYVAGGASVGNQFVGTITQSADLVPIMVGGAAGWDLGSLTVKGSLYAGYGLTGTHFDAGTAGSLDAAGDSFVGEVMAAGNYQVIQALAVGLNLGYRYTTQNTMVVTGGSGMVGGLKGHNMANFNTGQEIKSDFSGLDLGGAVTYSF